MKKQFLLLFFLVCFLSFVFAQEDIFRVKSIRVFNYPGGEPTTVFHKTEGLEAEVVIENLSGNDYTGKTLYLQIINLDTKLVEIQETGVFSVGAQEMTTESIRAEDLSGLDKGAYILKALVPKEGDEYEGNNSIETGITVLEVREVTISDLPIYFGPLLALIVLALILRKK